MLLTLDEALADRERQYVEFKEGPAETNAAAKALVGFANSRGGQVFFGVTDKGVARGFDVGKTTHEDLIRDLDMHIYPSLALESEEIALKNGKRVIAVWTPADKPPIVGGYLYSSRRLNLDDPVSLADAQAYRRVGRQTRKVDFMWLRGTLPSDPLIVLDAGKSQVQDRFIVLQWVAWHVSGGIALDLNVGTDPDVCTDVALKDLPGASGPRTGGTRWRWPARSPGVLAPA